MHWYFHEHDTFMFMKNKTNLYFLKKSYQLEDELIIYLICCIFNMQHFFLFINTYLKFYLCNSLKYVCRKWHLRKKCYLKKRYLWKHPYWINYERILYRKIFEQFFIVFVLLLNKVLDSLIMLPAFIIFAFPYTY